MTEQGLTGPSFHTAAEGIDSTEQLKALQSFLDVTQTLLEDPFSS